jgi:hypothetical protein
MSCFGRSRLDPPAVLCVLVKFDTQFNIDLYAIAFKLDLSIDWTTSDERFKLSLIVQILHLQWHVSASDMSSKKKYPPDM